MSSDTVPIRVGGYRLGKTIGVGAFGKVKGAAPLFEAHSPSSARCVTLSCVRSC